MFDMLYLRAGGGGGGATIFSFDKSTSLEGGSEKTLRWSGGSFKKMKGKNKEIIIAHPLDKLWMLPNPIFKLDEARLAVSKGASP